MSYSKDQPYNELSHVIQQVNIFGNLRKSVFWNLKMWAGKFFTKMFYFMQFYQKTKKYAQKQLLSVQYFICLHNGCAYQFPCAQKLTIFVQVVG